MSSDFQALAQDAIQRALADGTWREISWLQSAVETHGMEALLRNRLNDDKTATAGGEAPFAAEEEGPGWPEWASWRVQFGHAPVVVYFGREPRRSEIKAFADAYGFRPGDERIRIEEKV